MANQSGMIGHYKTRNGELLYGDGCDVCSHCEDCPFPDCCASYENGRWKVSKRSLEAMELNI